MTENDVNPPINNDPMEKKKRIYRSPLVDVKFKKASYFVFTMYTLFINIIFF